MRLETKISSSKFSEKRFGALFLAKKPDNRKHAKNAQSFNLGKEEQYKKIYRKFQKKLGIFAKLIDNTLFIIR